MIKQKAQHVDNPVAAGLRLREARERAGLSQRELAGAACSPAYVSRLELGQRVPSIQLLRQLAKPLSVSADYLATGNTPTEDDGIGLLDAEIALRLDDLATATRLFGEALARAGSSGPQRAESLAGLGRVALREERHRDAIEQLSEAIELAGVTLAEQPSLAESLARAYAEAGELGPAIALLERCVAEYELNGDVPQFIRFSSLLGYALTDNGDLAGAERVVAGALARGHDVADPYARARLYWSQSRLLAERAQPEAAERYARKTLETLRATEDSYAIAHAIETLAHICLDLGRPQEALELLDEGEPLIQGAGTQPEIAHFRLERARAVAALGEPDEAAAIAMQLAGELAGLRKPVARGRSYLLLAGLFMELGDPARAQELYELAVEILEAQPPSKHLVAAYAALAELLKRKGQRDDALELLERAVGIRAPAPRAVRGSADR